MRYIHRDKVEKQNTQQQDDQRKESASTVHKSCLTDHANTHSHVINWKDIEVEDQGDGVLRRGIKESIQIRMTTGMKDATT